jgi:hypothetical protein
MLNPENVRLNDGHALLQVGEPLVLALGREAPLHPQIAEHSLADRILELVYLFLTF